MAERKSKVKSFVDKLAVEAEPGLTSAQLMVSPPMGHMLFVHAYHIEKAA
jgi:hypothetical protein